ncbi:MAG: DEAD/DEAH box helicase, partial [Myxococcales bacterium]|nr:DEAD/DEAH box helicase [Myxococcales bacterium]
MGTLYASVDKSADEGRGALEAFRRAIATHEDLRDALVYSKRLRASPPVHAPLPELPEALLPVLERRGIPGLYEHQVRSLEALQAGDDLALATPTASGKSLVYSLPVLADALRDPDARALFLFPLRALEQDQARKLQADIAALGPAYAHIRVAIYDGDTKASLRKKLRNDPPNVLISTPDMLHLGLLPYHENWRSFFENLHTVVIDELHTYRGIFGSHIAQVLRRLDRVARHHGARPRIVTTSATIGNPGELAQNLTARKFTVIERDGSPRSDRHVCLFNPSGSPYTTAALLFREAVGRGLRTIAFTKARTITELMYAWICEAEPSLRDKISAYRSGFLAEERREIESRLFRGDLLGVISTSALEMGIDVGGLDVCILVGYPGSQTATWQRAGRVGRGRDALIALVAQPDALDQYLVSHPKLFFSGAFEHAVLDPMNRDIAGGHLPCAAAELPLREDEAWLAEPGSRENVIAQEEAGTLLRSEAGDTWFAVRRRPHRDVDLRAAGASYAIVEELDGGEPRLVGSIGSGRVFAECHE